MKIQESGENYLETILLLSRRKAEVHAVDVAAQLGFSKPSVSRAIRILRDGGYLEIDAAGALRFTERGRLRAEETYERHVTFTRMLMRLGVSRETAEADACRIEHVVSEETYAAIKARLAEQGEESS